MATFINIADKRNIMMAVLLLLVMSGMFIKALVPAGFMPEATKDGMIALVICSGAGEKTVYMPAADMPGHKDAPHEETSGICDWQIFSGQKMLLSVDTVSLSPPLANHVNYTWPAAEKVLTHKDLPFAARGPPSA